MVTRRRVNIHAVKACFKAQGKKAGPQGEAVSGAQTQEGKPAGEGGFEGLAGEEVILHGAVEEQTAGQGDSLRGWLLRVKGEGQGKEAYKEQTAASRRP
ncbi:hypothetical protein AGMMS49928_00290 [Spirochaetia bacterium]|nr:hypothetical protein AGMMS49928_00290 [Spirochaetia bacterium]